MKRENTRVTNAQEGFDFLRFHFMTRFQKMHSKQVTYFYASKMAANRFRSKVRMLTKKSGVHIRKVEQVTGSLNLLIPGWSNYLNHSTASKTFL